jgi:phage terminase large subunit-like protein
MSLSAAQKLALLPGKLRRAWLGEQSRETLEQIEKGAWWWVGRPEQFKPPGDWLVWLIRSGRGWGKTRTGAEDLLDRVFRHPVDAFGQRTEWLVIAETLNDCRTACIEGNSGILSVLARMGLVKGKDFRYWKSPKLMIEFASGQVIYFEGADNADVGRGYNLAGLWADELAKWRYTYNAWYEGILPSLRAPLIDDHPRAVVTTTPKPIKLLIEWQHKTDGTVVITTGSIFDNIMNLSRFVVEELRKTYEGTRAGLQELYGHLLEDIEGALWSRPMIENNRIKAADLPELKMVVVSMDPGATGSADETGLVAVGRDYSDRDYVLADWTKRVVGHAAARRAWEMFRLFGATWLIIETNMGKKWLMQVVTDAYKEMQAEGLFPQGPPPVKDVTSLAGKKLRAEPVASRYEQNRWHHVGTFIELEDQMCTWVPGETESPDRIDALVQGGLFLMGREGKLVRIAAPSVNDYFPSSSGYG